MKNSDGRENRNVDSYLNTVDRLEPDIHPVDASAFYASAAISLRRIADQKHLRFSNSIVLAVGVVLGVVFALILIKAGVVTT